MVGIASKEIIPQDRLAMTQTIKNNRDANERGIIEFLRAAGCIVWQMDRKDGFDLLVTSRQTGTHIVEVKNPARKWKLTEAEIKKRFEIESVGRTYWIIEDITDAKWLLYQWPVSILRPCPVLVLVTQTTQAEGGGMGWSEQILQNGTLAGSPQAET